MFNLAVAKMEKRLLHLLKSLAVFVSMSASFAEQISPPFYQRPMAGQFVLESLLLLLIHLRKISYLHAQ